MGEYTELVGRLVTESKEWSHAKVRAERLGKSIAARSQCQSASAIMAEAATAIETLQAKVDKMREALLQIDKLRIAEILDAKQIARRAVYETEETR